MLASVYFLAESTGTPQVHFSLVKLSTKPQPPLPGEPIPAVARDATFNLNSCIQTGSLTGQVFLDGRGVHTGAVVVADPGSNTALTFPDGSFDLPGLLAGTYTVDITHPSYLRAGPNVFTITGDSTEDIGNVTLLGGDINVDDKINILDAAMVALVFAVTNGQPNFDPEADINGDGVIDIFDLVMIGTNFGCSLTDPTARCQRWDRP